MKTGKWRTVGLAAAAAWGLGCGGPPASAPHDSVPVESPDDARGASSAHEAQGRDAMAKGVSAVRQKDFAEAKRIFEPLAKREPSNAEAHFYLGVARENTGDRTGALEAYEAALRARKDFDDAAANASALYIDEGRFSDAIRVLEAIEPAKRKSSALAQNLGVAYASLDNRAKAKAAFDLARSLSPSDALVSLTYGQWLGKWKDPEALAMLKRAEAEANEDVGILASVGFELKGIGAFGDCVAVLDRALKLKEAAELRLYRSLCKLGQKDKKGALDDLLVATKNEPAYAPAHFYLGGRHADAGDFKKAAASYEAYLKLDPEGPLSKVARERAKLARDKAGKK